MMAAEVSGEETVTSGTGVAGGGGPETAPFPYYSKPSRVGVTDLGQGPTQTLRQFSNTSPDSLPDMSIMYPTSGGGDMTASATGGGQSGIPRTNSGSMCHSPNSEESASQFSPTSKGPDSPTAFPPLPPPPPAPAGCAGHGVTMDESDMQDGPECEDDEVLLELSAPPTNQ